jgi:hypothetical protein
MLSDANLKLLYSTLLYLSNWLLPGIKRRTAFARKKGHATKTCRPKYLVSVENTEGCTPIGNSVGHLLLFINLQVVFLVRHKYWQGIGVIRAEFEQRTFGPIVIIFKSYLVVVIFINWCVIFVVRRVNIVVCILPATKILLSVPVFWFLKMVSLSLMRNCF